MFLGLSLREWSSLLGVLAFAGVLWRVVGFWPEMSDLERVLGLLLLSTVVIGAVGTYRLDMLNAPASGVTAWVICHRIACLVTVALWGRLHRRLP